MTRLILTVLLYSCCSLSYSNPVSVSDLFQSPDAFSYVISPKESYVAGFVAEGEKGVLNLLKVDTNETVKIYEFNSKDSIYLNRFTWIDENTLFIRYYKKKKIKQGFIYVDGRNGSKEYVLQDIAVDGTLIDPLEHIDNKMIFLYKKGSDIDDLEIYTATVEEVISGKFNIKTKYLNKLDDAYYYATNDSHEIKVAVTYEDENFYYWYFSDEKDDWVRFYQLNSDDYDFTPIGFIDNNSMAVLTNKFTDSVSLVTFNLADQTFGEVLYQHKKYDLVSASINSNNKTVDFVQFYDHGQLTTHYVSTHLESLGQQLSKSFPNKQITINSRIDDGAYMVVFEFDSNDPGSFYLYNTKSKEKILLAKRYKHLETSQFNRSRTFTVSNGTGFDIEAILTLPNKTSSNNTLLVIPHGGPVGVRDYNAFNSENQFFSSRGYAVLNVNFRGSIGFGKSFKDSGRGQFGKKIEEDITAVVEQVQSEYQFKKRCALGASYGGYSAVMLGIYHPNDYDCIVAMYGVYDLPLLYNASNIKLHEKYQNAFKKVVGEEKDELVDFSPFYLSDKITQPILLIAGTADKISDIEHSNRMKYRLRKSGKSIEHLFYKNVGHGHDDWRWDRHQYAYIDDFLRRTLNLPEINSDKYQDIVQDEAMILGDSFNFNDIVKDNPEFAFRFYKRAAFAGAPRGMHNFGSYYHRGEFVEESLKTAMDWYKKASKAGYDSSSYRLGILHSSGEVEKDLPLAFNYFKKAKEQGSKDAKVPLAGFYCKGEVVERNLETCFSQLGEDVKASVTHNYFMDLISDTVWKQALTKKEKLGLKSLLEDYYDNVEMDRITVSAKKEGVFSKSGSRYQLKLMADTFNLEDDLWFGGEYEINSSVSEHNRLFLFVKAKWTHPTLTNPNTGETYSTREHAYIGYKGRTFTYRRHLSNEWERKAGKWTLQIMTLDDTVLYEKTFILKNKPSVND